MGSLFWIIIVSVISISLIIISYYNKIITTKNSVIRSWSDIITYERQKNNILPKIESIVTDYQKYESDLQLKITELRSAINAIKANELDHNMLKNIEDQTKTLITGIKAALENYPNLKTVSLMKTLMHQISQQQQNIAAAITIFNKNIEVFNNGLQTFPSYIINKHLNKEHVLEPFLELQAVSSFEYKFKL